MRVAKALSGLGLLAMSAALVNGFLNGSFTADGGRLLSNPWGIVSLVDLYVGFMLFALWIFYREASKRSAILWTLLVMVLGFWAASLYVLITLNRCQDDWPSFWMGKHAHVAS